MEGRENKKTESVFGSNGGERRKGKIMFLYLIRGEGRNFK
jgi:hypothetical protein